MTDAHDAVEMMEWMIDQKGLTPETAPAERDRLLDELRADARRTFSDPDRLDAALQYLANWQARP